MNDAFFTTGRAWSEFKYLSFAAQIYIVCFVLVFASGQTFLHGYVPQIMMVMLGVSFFSVLERQRAKRERSIRLSDRLCPGTILLLLIALFCTIQTMEAFAPSIAKTYSSRYFIFAVLTLFAVQPSVFAICMRFTSVYLNICAVSLIVSSIALGTKTGGLLGNYQAGGMMMSIACMLNIIDYYRSDRGSKYLWLSLLTAAALLVTGKRTFAIIAFAGVLVLYAFASRTKTSLLKVVVVVLLISGVCLAAYEFTDFGRKAFERFALLSSNDEFSAMSGRNLLWDAAWATFKEHPLTGIGFGGFERWYAAFYAGNRGAAYLTHNIYYGMLAETGVVGTFLFCMLFSWGIVSTARSLVAARRLEHGRVSDYVLVVSLALQIWFVAYGFTGNGIYDANEMFFYVIALVMNLSVRYSMRIEELDSKPTAKNPRRKVAAHA